MTLQLRPEVGEAGQQAFHGVRLRGQRVCVPPDGAEGVQLIIEVGEAREDVSDVSLDVADTLQAGLQGGAALLDLRPQKIYIVKDKYCTAYVSFLTKT